MTAELEKLWALKHLQEEHHKVIQWEQALSGAKMEHPRQFTESYAAEKKAMIPDIADCAFYSNLFNACI